MVCPDPGVAVGLQLRAHRPRLRPLPVVADLVENALEVLDVVAVLVGDHVGLRERSAARPELVAEVVEEPEVDVDVPVARAVEGPDVRVRRAAPGADGAVERASRYWPPRRRYSSLQYFWMLLM